MTPRLTYITTATLLGAIGKTVASLGETTVRITGAKSVELAVQMRGRGQPKALQYRAFGLYIPGKGKPPSLYAGAWQESESLALRSLVVDFEQSNLPRIGEAVRDHLNAGPGELALPDAGRHYRVSVEDALPRAA